MVEGIRWRKSVRAFRYVARLDPIVHSFTNTQIRLHTEQPFDCILGFSQGACFAGILGCLLARVQCVVCVGGFRPRSIELSQRMTMDGRIDVPSLHIIGKKDEWVTPESSMELAQCYASHNRTVYHHEGGYYNSSRLNSTDTIYLQMPTLVHSSNHGSWNVSLEIAK